jgi:general stress protein 26
VADNTTEKNPDDATPAGRKLDDLYKLIDGIEVAMFTTRRADGQLVSRPMQAQKRNEHADLWFVTDVESHKLDELQHDDHVNLAFYKDRTREWVSVAGVARISQDRGLIREVYQPDWRAWFGDEGGERDGGPDDPRLALVLVQAQSVIYSISNKPQPLVLFEVAKGMITGTPPDVADLRQMGERELRRAGFVEPEVGEAPRQADRSAARDTEERGEVY